MSSGPAIYFPSASADEVVRYANVYADTELEKALLRVTGEKYETEDADAFISAMRDIADDDFTPTRLSEPIYAALQEIDPQ